MVTFTPVNRQLLFTEKNHNIQIDTNNTENNNGMFSYSKKHNI